jgi:hypothetical protein
MMLLAALFVVKLIDHAARSYLLRCLLASFVSIILQQARLERISSSTNAVNFSSWWSHSVK